MLNVIFYLAGNVPNVEFDQNRIRYDKSLKTFLKFSIYIRKKFYENYSELNLSQIVESNEEAIMKISNISNIAEAAEKVIEEAAEILNIIPPKNETDETWTLSNDIEGMLTKLL